MASKERPSLFPLQLSNKQNPFWRDDRFFKILVQVIALLVILSLAIILGNNLVANFRRLGLNFGFNFLFDPDRPASFSIGDSPIPYQATDPYLRALIVGLLNSLRVMVSGIILATILGITIGLGRLSDNWLVRQIATVYVEILRNTPLLLQLFFWYFLFFLQLPKIESPAILWNSVFFSNQGIYLPWPAGTIKTWLSLAFLALSAVLAVSLWRKQNQAIAQPEASRIPLPLLGISLTIASIIVVAFGLDWQQPQYNPAIPNIQGGLSLSPEFATLLIGLTAYTAAFIAEVVRAGMQSVPQGQLEAAKALGLKPNLTVQLVIFPQALQVIIPPLTSQFLNLAKNSSLAIAIGYNDIYAVATTISNQTGNAIEMLLVVMGAYLSFNLLISIGMNWFNRAVQIKER